MLHAQPRLPAGTGYLFQRIGILREGLLVAFIHIGISDLHRDMRAARSRVITVAPDTIRVVRLNLIDIVAQNMCVLVRRVHIKKHQSARLHKQSSAAQGPPEFFGRPDVIERIECGHGSAHRTVKVQLCNVLAQQQQAFLPRFPSLLPQDAEHLRREVYADHIISRGRQAERQFSRTAPQVRHDAVLHTVSAEHAAYIPEQGVIVRVLVERVIYPCKCFVSHYTSLRTRSSYVSRRTARLSSPPRTITTGRRGTRL